MASKGNSRLTSDKGKSKLEKARAVIIVRTNWNPEIVDELEKGCIKVLKEKKIPFRSITVPGAVEIPFAVKKYYEEVGRKKDAAGAFVTLGCVIRGDTPHFDYVCKAVTDGVSQLNLILPVPVIFGVLTVENDKQAKERIGGKHGHKGEEAALTAIAMMELVESFGK
ncbi:6,7-dimethyl-8-ribityllumazine synthase [Pollutibacter soli]|uniref:6,7-dimethyl-8-ribityllumazine synthase n=1 Tax=Pollutibacter soli TaxID=3034157 RepID=UPI003013FDFA